MKISYVELAGFRGFREPTRIEFAPGFVVLTGRNGTGKSTILDAIDFVLTGTIDKFQVTNAKGGGLASHIWWMGDVKASAQYACVAFVDEFGHEFVLTRSPDRPMSPALEVAADMLCNVNVGQNWERTLVNTTLIRDETITKLSMDLPGQARFEAVRSAIGALTGPDRSIRTAAIVDAAKIAKAAQDDRLAKLRVELGRAISSLTEARSAADRQPDIAEAETSLKRIAPDIEASAPDATERMRRRLAERKQSIATLTTLIVRAENAASENGRLSSDGELAKLAEAQRQVADLNSKHNAAADEFKDASAVAQADREADRFAAGMVALLRHGEEIGLIEGHCPLCDAIRSDTEFAAAIAAARERLAERGENSTRLQQRVEEASAAANLLASQARAAADTLKTLQSERDRNSSEIEALNKSFLTFELGTDASNPTSARQIVLKRQEDTAELEHALYILEASAAYDRVAALELRIEKLRAQLEEEDVRSTKADKALEAAKLIDNAAKTVANQVLAEQFDTVMPLLKELYQRLRPHAEWREIETDFGGKIRATLDFTVGDGKIPSSCFRVANAARPGWPSS